MPAQEIRAYTACTAALAGRRRTLPWAAKDDLTSRRSSTPCRRCERSATPVRRRWFTRSSRTRPVRTENSIRARWPGLGGERGATWRGTVPTNWWVETLRRRFRRRVVRQFRATTPLGKMGGKPPVVHRGREVVVGLLRRRDGTRDGDRQCEGKQPPLRAQVVRPGGALDIACLTQGAFAPYGNRKSTTAAAV